MVTQEQIQRGITRYADSEFTSKIYGWQKWIFGAGAALAIDNIGKIIDSYRQNPLLQKIGVFDPGGGINVDLVYPYLRAEAEKGTVTFDLPIVGSTTLSVSDVEKLYQCIMQG